MMAEGMKPPLLYPCASKVKMPNVGADETTIKSSTTSPRLKLSPSKAKNKEPPAPNISKGYLKKISANFSFSEDVVKERSYHTLPYDRKYFYEALDISDIIPTPPKVQHPTGRHNARGSNNKHLPCHIKQRSQHKLKPMKRRILEKALEMHQEAINKEKGRLQKEEETEQVKEQFFVTEREIKSDAATVPQHDWDEYMVSLLSETTARWVVNNQLDPSEQQDRLNTILNTYYGPTDERPELIRDNSSEGDLTERSKKAGEGKTRKWKRADESLLDRVRDMQKQSGKPTDPYCDDSGAAFYRLPAGLRKAKKNQEKEQAGSINTTAFNIEVKPYEPPPPPNLRDFINPNVGNKMFDTSNMFQQEWLTGAEQIHLSTEGKEKLLLDTNNKYMKSLQKETPRQPQIWFPPTEKETKKLKEDQHKVKVFDKGMHRWKGLPEPIDDTAEKLSLMMPGVDSLMTKSPDPTNRKMVKENSTLVQIVDDWRSKWNLDMRYADAVPDDLIRDMADKHVHIRLKAITTCARAAEYIPPPEPGIQLEMPRKVENQIKLLPERLFIALECCTDDAHEQVRRAAAIALYTLERPSPKAEEILRKTLKESKSVDRWTAAQCLAYYGECDSEVVGELISQLLNTEDNIRHERAAHLLAKLSESSFLVHSMIGEQLNSSSWRHRVMACKVIPKLYGHINRDLVLKLTHLMWNDWHTEVRKAAAQTLGKTGHGKDVHDELRDKILSGNERQRVEAVSKIGHLGIMTAKLLPAFLQCFSDNYVSVRTEACVACTNLRIKEEQVLDQLVFLATYDPIWKVKALALQALAIIGVVRDNIRDCVLWALRYEDKEGVRAEACHTIVKLQLKDKDVGQILQDRLLVETSPIVKLEMAAALEMFGISATEDMDMVAQIKKEVRKLCTRDNICTHIHLNEQEEDKQENINRMIYQSHQQRKAAEERAQSRLKMLHSGLSKQTQRQARSTDTPDPSSGGATSREGTMVADQEIRDVLERDDTSESAFESHPDSRSMPKTPSSDTGTESVVESGLDAETGSVVTNGTRSAMSRIPEEGEDQSNAVHTNKDNKRLVVLGEKQTYVEISSRQDEADTHDVVKIKYDSPPGGDTEGSQSGTETDTLARPQSQGSSIPDYAVI